MARNPQAPSGEASVLSNGPPPQLRSIRAVILIGFMGAGKTSVGRALATLLGWKFEDLDDRIEARERRSIPQIFELSGETGFREAEHQALRSCLVELQSSSGPEILAVGGGASTQPQNQVLFEAAGFPVVFLDAPVEELWRRCSAQDRERPLRGDLEQFCRLYECRRPYYLRASLRVETAGKAVETIAVELASQLRLR